MSNIQAALLLPQFARMGAKLEQREALAQQYNERLQQLGNLVRPATRSFGVHCRHLYPVRVAAQKRDHVIEALKAEQIGCVVNYRAVHLTQYFREKFSHARGDFPVAERIGDEILSLPFYPGMPLEHVEIVVDALARALE
jgi:UDP-4-amino-4-deoxy-L-arabinose-oxoglutarate aminotransferase